MSDYVRFQSAVPNRRGTYPGVFALANGLRLSGLLSAEEGEWMDAANARASESYADPRSVDPDCYDRDINPGARAWFRATAADLLAFTGDYLALLDRHDVPWQELRTRTPGRIVYADDVQVIATPHTVDDWPFR
ncbi:hypothetical protein FGG90_14305 [Clavibacter tessellarius]|uniref:Uncharacterized protein n=1 Tax=Clavibacter tessellarius TaxID=31965 RepID=A0A225CB72_9MICO|nr:hypothetical protein [Clavibacter michiganensis]MBT1635336.1 hypothetical protein [Clavibacter michiganensis]OQJ61961.1 hypothetical protein B5P24_02410 [Clavibacter michiganensis subsp. tessellarius]UKF35042.1 hypothetical protein FGG90_14305 [Clavibacter michiganensis subsp. tessellarius]